MQLWTLDLTCLADLAICRAPSIQRQFRTWSMPIVCCTKPNDTKTPPSQFSQYQFPNSVFSHFQTPHSHQRKIQTHTRAWWSWQLMRRSLTMYRVQCLQFHGAVRKFRRSWYQHFQQKQLHWTVLWISYHGWGYTGLGFWIPPQNGKNPKSTLNNLPQNYYHCKPTAIPTLQWQIANPSLTWYLEQPCLTVKSFVRSYWQGRSRDLLSERRLTSDGVHSGCPSWRTLWRKWWRPAFYDRLWKVDTMSSMMKTKFSKIVQNRSQQNQVVTETLQKKKIMILWECEMYKYPPHRPTLNPVTCHHPFRWIHIHS